MKLLYIGYYYRWLRVNTTMVSFHSNEYRKRSNEINPNLVQFFMNHECIKLIKRNVTTMYFYHLLCTLSLTVKSRTINSDMFYFAVTHKSIRNKRPEELNRLYPTTLSHLRLSL